MSFSGAIRKARDLGRRSLALARPAGGMVEPRARYAPRPHDAVLVLARGENASLDYYLRPRLHPASVPVEFADLHGSPGRSAMLSDPSRRALLVVVCRYASAAWLQALETARPRIARFAFFADDDLPAMAADRRLPLAVRGKVAEGFGQWADRLSDLAGEVWLSTPALAGRYPTSHAVVLPPIPEADPPAPAAPHERLVVYHGTDVHGPERAFAVEVAKRLRMMGCDAPVEITGDLALARNCRGLRGLRVTPQAPWPDYLAHVRSRRAAVFLAPLSASAVNAARAPVKTFDAARLGATGLFANRQPYRDFVEDGADGRLLPDDPQAWAEAVVELLGDPAARIGLAERAAGRLRRLRADGLELPPPPPPGGR